MSAKYLVISLLCILAGTTDAVVTWKGPTVGNWNYTSNWAGGLPNTNSIVKLDHDRQTSAYTVVVQSAAVADKVWLQSFGDIPIHVRVDAGGTLNLNMLRMGDKAEDRISSFTIDGGSVFGQAATASITNTSFLVGNNPEGTASLTLTNSGSMTLLGANGLTVASRAGSTGNVYVANSDLQVKASMIIAQGAGSSGELILSDASSVAITGALHIAKLDNGAISPNGSVLMMDGLLECGTLNVGAAGNGLMILNDGEVRIFGGGITLGKLNSTGLLTMNGGSMTTIGSPLNIGHTDSYGTLDMNGGSISVDGIISVGAASRSYGEINLTGGSITANQLTVGAAVSSIGECSLLNGELRILGTSPTSIQISNGTVRIEKAFLKWGNPNVTEVITNAVASGELTWTNGVAAGTYSTHGFDGRIVNGGAALYWDNSDNGSQFGPSAIWVEQIPEASPYDDWAFEYNLLNEAAELMADPDFDGLDNLTEYGLGGNPTNANDIGILPTFGMQDIAGTNWVEYIYPQRSDASARGLDYYLELSTNLVAGTWTNAGYDVIGTSVNDNGFEMVTNHASTINYPTLFIRFRIQIE